MKNTICIDLANKDTESQLKTKDKLWQSFEWLFVAGLIGSVLLVFSNSLPTLGVLSIAALIIGALGAYYKQQERISDLANRVFSKQIFLQEVIKKHQLKSLLDDPMVVMLLGHEDKLRNKKFPSQ